MKPRTPVPYVPFILYIELYIGTSIVEMAKSLQKSRTLKEVNLSWNGFDDEVGS